MRRLHLSEQRSHIKPTRITIQVSSLSPGASTRPESPPSTIRSEPGTTEDETKARWNEYLKELGLPQVEEVGTGLPDHLRCRDSEVARILMSILNTAAVPEVVAPPVDPVVVAETAGAGAVTSGEAGTSMAAFGATVRDTATTSRAGHEGAATRLASVEEAMNGATEENDEELFLALHTFLGWRVVVNVPRGSNISEIPLYII